MLARVADVAARHRLRVANVFHAGDGNLHPCILFDDRDADERARVSLAGREILQACLELGGSLSGEHGIGVEKREAMRQQFSEPSLAAMLRLRDAFDPRGLCNPGKILPTGGGCVEVPPRHRQAAPERSLAPGRAILTSCTPLPRRASLWISSTGLPGSPSANPFAGTPAPRGATLSRMPEVAASPRLSAPATAQALAAELAEAQAAGLQCYPPASRRRAPGTADARISC
jgi:hypothetical protein